MRKLFINGALVFAANAIKIMGACNLAPTLESARFSLEATAAGGDLVMTAIMEMKLKSESSFVQDDRTV